MKESEKVVKMSFKLRIFAKWEDSRERAFLSLLEFNPTAKVIDLGCGRGEFTLKVKEKTGCSEIGGVDVYGEAIAEAKRKGINIKKVDLNEFLPFAENSFDIIVSNQVIEHLFYPVRFMKEIYRILDFGGYAIISTENLASWDNIFSLLLGYTPFSMEFDGGLYKIGNPLSPHEKEIVENYPPHVRIFTCKGLIELAKFVGFKVERVIGNGHILGKFGELANKENCRFVTIKIRK